MGWRGVCAHSYFAFLCIWGNMIVLIKRALVSLGAILLGAVKRGLFSLLTLLLGVSVLSMTSQAVTVDASFDTGTQSYLLTYLDACEVASYGQFIRFEQADDNSLSDYFYIGITDSTGTIPRGVNGALQPTLATLKSGLSQLGSTAGGVVLQSDLIGPNGPTVSNPWYWTVWEGTAVDPSLYFGGVVLQGAIVGQIAIPNSTWDVVPAGAGIHPPCRPVLNDAPIANAGSDSVDLVVGGIAALTGAASTDADNDTLTYAWTQISGPTVVLSDATAVSPTFTVPATAISTPIVFSLIVNDGTVDSSADTVSFMATNTAPIANAGADQTGIVPETLVQLDGTGSTDGDNDALTYAWTQTSGATVVLSDATGVNPTFTIPVAAINTPIVFSLIVNDGTVNSSADTVNLMAVNRAPIANAGADQTGIVADSMVQLDGATSTDADNDTLTYAWTQTSGAVVVLSDATAVNPTFTIPTAAVSTPIVFSLIVNDGTVDSLADTVSIQAGNRAPVASVDVDQADIIVGSKVRLDGTTSSDADSDALTYAWTQVSGPTVTLSDATAARPTFVMPAIAVGTPIVFSLVVSDGTISSPAVTVSVMAANRAPIANAGADQTDNVPDSIVRLDGTASSDADGDILTYAWTQTSGASVVLSDATAAEPTFTIPAAAVTAPIVFSLIVNDGSLDSSVDTVSIAAQNRAPIADSGVDQTDIVPGLTVRLDGTGSSDADNDVLSYVWTQVSGVRVDLAGANTAAPNFVAPGGTDAALVFRLVVNDGIENSPADMVSISVQDNIAVTKKAIEDFLTARNALLLSYQPDMQRRIDRLAGRTSGGGSVSIDGISVPGSRHLPVSINARQGAVSASASLSSARTQMGKSVGGKGTFDVWGEAYLSDFSIGEKQNRSGAFNIYYAGADYMVSSNALVGIMVSSDRIEYDPLLAGGSGAGVQSGDGWMVGPYGTAHVSDTLYVDGRVMFGKSDNRISPFGTYRDDFKTSRILVSGAVTGEHHFSKRFLVRPELSAQYISEESDGYTDSLGSVISSVENNQGQISLAPRFHYEVNVAEHWKLRPYGEVRGIYSFGDNVEALLGSKTRLRAEIGADLFSPFGLRLSASAFSDGIGADGFESKGYRLAVGFTL